MKTNSHTTSKQIPRRKRTGEPRSLRRPLKMDRLPEELRQRVLRERADGATWEEIEAMSHGFEEWGKVAGAVQALFPGRRLPNATVQRWYDLRVEQVERETRAMSEQARALAAVFRDSKFEDLPQAVQGALRDQIFALLRSGGDQDKHKAIAELHKLAHLLVQQQRADVLKGEHLMRKQKLNKETKEARQKVLGRRSFTPKEIERIRVNVFGVSPRRVRSPQAPEEPKPISGWPNGDGTFTGSKPDWEAPKPQAPEPQDPRQATPE